MQCNDKHQTWQLFSKYQFTAEGEVIQTNSNLLISEVFRETFLSFGKIFVSKYLQIISCSFCRKYAWRKTFSHEVYFQQVSMGWSPHRSSICLNVHNFSQILMVFYTVSKDFGSQILEKFLSDGNTSKLNLST